MNSTLTAKKCQPCDAGTGKLDPAGVAELLPHVPGWTHDTATDNLHRSFKFKNHYEAMAFVNAVAWISHREDHHPNIELGYNTVDMRYNTHAANGLTENDFICAAKVNSLLSI